MQYTTVVPGKFRSRPNRFIAHIEIDGADTVCHVKNTGRCRELLAPGAQVWCAVSDNPNRKTKHDLIAVQKGNRLINMDSQAPNAAVKQWLLQGGMGQLENVKPETVYHGSRFDFSFVKDGKPCFLEVKGVTLENGGICAFPDAPTTRGTKHLEHLQKALADGYGAYVLFVVQMTDVSYLHPNDATDPEFGKALRKAADAGVQVLAMDCAVTPNSMMLQNPVPVVL